MSAVDGTLALRAASGEWAASRVNDPVASGMSVWTAPQGRAVLRSGAETIALSAATVLDVARLDVGGIRLVLRQGRIGLRFPRRTAAALVDEAGVRRVDPVHNVEIDIPRGGIWLLTPGDYDIATGDEHMPARIAVLDGHARFVGKGIDTVIATGSATLLGGSDPIVARADSAPVDDFVGWWRLAESDDAGTEALRYVSAEMTGYAALDDSGSWESVDGYGAVWFPQSTPDEWAPYRDGHWRWIQPWGWTWIDDMPWGFAPSHYGRWARIPGADPGTGRWGWVPGSRVAHPVYAPALVAFLGTAGVGLSYPDAVGPAVAWFPLAPGEAYWPSYTNDLDAIRRINEGSVDDSSMIGPAVNGAPPAVIVNGDYQNRRFASAVPRSAFTGGRPVPPSLLQLPGTRLANAPLLAGSPLIAPPPARAAGAPASGAAGRLAEAMAPKPLGAMHAIARAITRRATPVRRAALVRPARGRGRIALALARHSHWPGAHLARPRVIAVNAAPTGRPRLRLAAARRR